MSDQWGVYHCTIDGKPARVTVDLAHADAPLPDRPLRLDIELQLRVVDHDGLAVENEIEALADVEERCIDVLSRRLDALYVGRIEHDSRCTLTFHLANHPATEAAVREALSTTPGWTWRQRASADPGWTYYRRSLYPDARRYRSLLNQITVDNLQQFGDEIHQVRPVQHFIEFADAESRKRFLEQVNRLGYRLISTRDDVGGARPFTLAICREHACDARSVDAVVDELMDLAAPLGGEYDGWESQVICAGDDLLDGDEDDGDETPGPRLAR